MQRISERVSELYHDPESWKELDLRLKDVRLLLQRLRLPESIKRVFASESRCCFGDRDPGKGESTALDANFLIGCASMSAFARWREDAFVPNLALL